MPSWETCQLIKEYEDLRKQCGFATKSSCWMTSTELKDSIITLKGMMSLDYCI